jgi:Bacteriocin (Lactococcin_972)
MAVKKSVASAIAALGLSVGVAAPALATLAYPAGGIWDYGTGGGRVWSDFNQGASWHGSSVAGKTNYSSPCTEPGTFSLASAEDRWYAVDHAYYWFC